MGGGTGVTLAGRTDAVDQCGRFGGGGGDGVGDLFGRGAGAGLLGPVEDRGEDLTDPDRGVGEQRGRDAVGVLGTALEVDPAAEFGVGGEAVVPLDPDPAAVVAVAAVADRAEEAEGFGGV